MSAFTIYPMNQTISLEPGEVYEDSIVVANPADAAGNLNYRVSVTPYSVVGIEYAADFVTQSNLSMIVDWISLDEYTGTLAPNESARIKYKITVPASAPAGGQYATLAVQASTAENGESGVNIGTVLEMASVIYANVAGETTHGGEILENTAPGFVADGEVMTRALISNTGNQHEMAISTITVKNAVTGEQIFPRGEETNSYYEMILPETTRLITRKIDNLPALGVFTISQEIVYRDEVSAITQNVVICPFWFMGLVALTGAVLVATIVKIVKKHKKQRKIAENC